MTKCEEDDAFMEFRARCMEIAKNAIEDLLSTWMNEYGIEDQIGYSQDMIDNVLTLYTTRPGYIIGKEGNQIIDLQNRLGEMYAGTWTVKIHEIKNGGFVSTI